MSDSYIILDAATVRRACERTIENIAAYRATKDEAYIKANQRPARWSWFRILQPETFEEAKLRIEWDCDDLDSPHYWLYPSDSFSAEKHLATELLTLCERKKQIHLSMQHHNALDWA